MTKGKLKEQPEPNTKITIWRYYKLKDSNVWNICASNCMTKQNTIHNARPC